MALNLWQEKDFNNFMASKTTAIIEFSAPWCGACKATEPILEELAKQFSDISFAKIDVSKDSALASKMGVMSLPNILIISSGKIVQQLIGGQTKAKLETELNKITAKA